MTKLSDLVLRTSDVTGVPLATVREISRRLREGGLIRTGKGGRYGGADMTPHDAARLLTALLIVRVSASSLADIVSHTKAYLDLQSHGARGRGFALGNWERQLGLPELTDLKSGHTLESAFTALIASFLNNQFERRMDKWGSGSVELTIMSARPLGGISEPEARITITGDKLWTLLYLRPAAAKYITPTMPTKWSDIFLAEQFDLSVQSRISEATLKSVGLLLQDSKTTHG